MTNKLLDLGALMTLEEGTTSLARRESELFVISMHSIPDAEAGTGTSLWL